MRRFLITFMALGLVVSAVTATQAKGTKHRPAERTVKLSYHGPQPLYEYRSCSGTGDAGCITLETRPNERVLSAKVADAHGLPTAVWVVDAAEDYAGFDGPDKVYGAFCGETKKRIRFPRGTTLELWVGGQWWPTWWIVPELDCSAPGTTGDVQVTLSTR